MQAILPGLGSAKPLDMMHGCDKRHANSTIRADYSSSRDSARLAVLADGRDVSRGVQLTAKCDPSSRSWTWRLFHHQLLAPVLARTPHAHTTRTWPQRILTVHVDQHGGLGWLQTCMINLPARQPHVQIQPAQGTDRDVGADGALLDAGERFARLQHIVAIPRHVAQRIACLQCVWRDAMSDGGRKQLDYDYWKKLMNIILFDSAPYSCLASVPDEQS